MRRDWSKIGEIAEKIKELGLSVKEGAKRFDIEPAVLYEYNKRRRRDRKEVALEVSDKKESSETGDSDAAKGVEESPVALPGDVAELIRAYRRENPRYGFKRIQDILKGKYLVIISRKQIRNILRAAGLLETCDSSFDREEEPSKGMRRFEAARPGEIWQMDVAYLFIPRIPVLYLVVIIDDHSRFCVAAELCHDQRAQTLAGVLHEACIRHGIPQKLLTDQGSGFYSWSKEQTLFQEYLDDQKIEHIVAEPHSPQSQGKVERLIQTIRKDFLSQAKLISFEDAQVQIRSFRDSYNTDRPHQGIGGGRPVDRFYGVAGEVEQAESQLAGRELDLSRGYVIYKVEEHRICIVWGVSGLQVHLDGKLLKEAESDGSKR